MKKIVFVYDNIYKPNKRIQKIIGNKSFAEIILKKKSVYSRYVKILKNGKNIIKIEKLDNKEDIDRLIQNLKNNQIECNIVHLFSQYAIVDEENFKNFINKANFINENIVVTNNNNVSMLMYHKIEDYLKYLKAKMELNYSWNEKVEIDIENYNKIEENCLINIDDYTNFLRYISGGFDTRYFNNLKTDDNVVIKSSTNKEKIKREYMYYKLLPEDMQRWMVEPYNYVEEKEEASYTMERLYIPDIAIRWVHEAINEEEFRNILNKVFYYINTRKTMKIEKTQYYKISNELYIKKLKDRVEDLKKCDNYDIIKKYIEIGTNYGSIDDIVSEYEKLYYQALEKETNYKIVIGHGDLCFSNMLYDNEINLLKLIDPKGALKEEELWTNPNYDIAKLSHSICGRYDFFNSASYEIKLDSNLKFKLELKFDNERYIKIFKEYLEKNDINYENIRIYEISLFLSMLPLHMDYPKKVFGFILNAIHIMEELKENKNND